MRHNDWEVRLSDFVQSRKNVPFSRGGHDCAMFACDCIKVMTGIDPAEWFRGRYKTKRGATMALRKYGGTLKECAESIFSDIGFCEVMVTKAQRGDVVLIEKGDNQALGIVDLDGINIILADQGQEIGVARMPIKHAVKAWRVG